jgi:ATP-dependent RNA helicase DDX31/DBP7
VKPEGGLANYGIGSYRKVQTALASATFTASIEALLKEHLGPHDFVDADGGVNATNSTPSRQLSHSFDIPEQLVQHSVSVTYKLKLAALTATLRNCWKSGEKVVMFLSTTAEVDFLDNLFRLTAWPDSTVSSKGSLFEQWPIYRLHGKVEQKDRAATFAAFHPLKSGLLICTDVAARGLDLPKVDFIIQYDPPTEVSDYVHRIGRTARRGCPGTSLLFLSPNESSFLDVLSSHGLKLIPLSLQATLDRGFSDSSKAKAQVTPLSLHEHLEKAVAKSATLHDMALCAYQAFVRAYSAHSGELKNVFQVRLLHLGHVARSFALQEAPRAIKDHVPKKSDKGKKRSIAEHLTSTSKQGSGNASKKMRPNGSSMTAADTI